MAEFGGPSPDLLSLDVVDERFYLVKEVVRCTRSVRALRILARISNPVNVPKLTIQLFRALQDTKVVCAQLIFAPLNELLDVKDFGRGEVESILSQWLPVSGASFRYLSIEQHRFLRASDEVDVVMRTHPFDPDAFWWQVTKVDSDKCSLLPTNFAAIRDVLGR